MTDSVRLIRNMHKKICSNRIKVLVNVLWDRLDCGIQIVFNIEHVILIFLTNEVECETKMAESTGTTNPMKIGIGLSWEIKVDNNVHGDDIDTSSEHIGGYETASFASLEVMEDAI